MGEFSYLPEVIAMTLLEYFGMLLILVKVARKYYPAEENKRWLIFEVRDYDSVATSIFGERYNGLLCVTRLLSMIFFLAIGIIWKSFKYGVGWQYFTNWNILFITVYFLGSFLASVLLVIAKRRNYDIWISDGMQKTIGTWLSIHFAIAGASAVFITTINFLLLNPRFEMFNTVSHFATSVALLVDLYLNNIRVHYLEFIFNFTWALIWMCFIWPVVAADVRGWPYDFLETDRSKCFMWYNIVFLANFLFYNIWWLMSSYKFKLFGEPRIDYFQAVSIDDDNSYISRGRYGDGPEYVLFDSNNI